MSDESEAVTAVAKAVEESAKTGRALVEAGSDLAKFVGKALGTVPEDAVGLLAGQAFVDVDHFDARGLGETVAEPARNPGAGAFRAVHVEGQTDDHARDVAFGYDFHHARQDGRRRFLAHHARGLRGHAERIGDGQARAAIAVVHRQDAPLAHSRSSR